LINNKILDEVSVGILPENRRLEEKNIVGDVCRVSIEFLKPTNKLIKSYEVFDDKVIIRIGQDLGIVKSEVDWFIQKFGRHTYIKRLKILYGMLTNQKRVECRHCGRLALISKKKLESAGGWKCLECGRIHHFDRETTTNEEELPRA
jgi:hypothetical protein